MENDGVPLTFPARFPNIFVDYPLRQIRVGDKLWTNWNKAALKLWQTVIMYYTPGHLCPGCVVHHYSQFGGNYTSAKFYGTN